jgi:ATP synthase F0 subunit b
MAIPSIFPTGTTIYKPEKCWNGYTLFHEFDNGATLIDMNGNVVRHWKDFQGFPNKMLPGGHIMGSLGVRKAEYGYQDQSDLTQIDWDGNIVWSFNKKEYIEDSENEKYWLARQHHDYQREGNPVGYYVPGMECKVDGGNTLILCHEDVYNKRISDKKLLDDCIVEVDWEGNIVWKWNVSDHFRELDFDEFQKSALFRNPNYHPIGKEGQSDWMHINSMSTLGPNKWYDQGDERFHPDNIIWDAREANIMAIISKKTGKIVWQIGPDFTKTKELRRIGQIIGQHHCHMIPKGLPGEGNILIFDNGGYIKAEADQILADAKSDRLEIVSEAKKLRDQIIAEAKNEAEREAAKIKEATAREIQQEKENAIKEIRSQMTELSVGVAEKVLRRELSDSNSQAALINSLLDEINVAKS